MTLLLPLFALLSLLLPQPQAEIVFAGDAMQHQIQLDCSRRAGGAYDYSMTFAEIMPWVSGADYAVVNLETTLGAGNFTGYPCFCSPDSYAAALRDAGFDLFLTANNHTLDRSDRGLRRTVSVLDSLGVDHIGTYIDSGTRRRAIPFVRDINGFKVGFLNYTYGTNGIKARGAVVVDYIDREQIKKDIEATRRAGAEIIIALPHWGVEYQLHEHPAQRSLAKFLHDNGVDIVMGGHPHVVQPMHLTGEGNDRRVTVYSMGNFLSGMRTTDTRGGAMTRIILRRDFDGRAYIAGADYRLVFSLPGRTGSEPFRLIFVDEDTDINKAAGGLAPLCRAFATSALRLFDSTNTSFPRYPHGQPAAAAATPETIVNAERRIDARAGE